MAASEFVGEFAAFKGDEDYIESQNILLEVVDVTDDVVEIGFYAPMPGRPRCYIKLSLAELVKQSMSD